MRVFVSYAAEDRAAAESLALRLGGEGHTVFFAPAELAAGGTYDREIRHHLRRADLLVFLISPFSVARGAYPLSELRMAQERWPHPRGRVLPVMLAPVPFEEMPPYLAAVSAFEPLGDLNAEVAARLHALQRARRQRLWRRVAAGAAAAGLLAVAGWWWTAPTGHLALTVDSLRRSQQGLAASSYLVTLTVGNGTTVPVSIDAVEAEHANQGVYLQPTMDVDGDLPVHVDADDSRQWAFHLRPLRRATYVPLDGGALADTRWRLCWTAVGERRCTDWLAWAPVGAVAPSAVRPIAAPLGPRARRVASTANAFVVALGNPPAVALLDTDGETLVGPLELDGAVAAIDVWDGLVYAATRAPNAVLVLDAATLAVRRSVPVRVTELDDERRPLSSEPASLAAGPFGVWLITDAESGGSRLYRLEDSEWVRLPYSDGWEFDTADMRLRRVGTAPWAIENLSPASVYRLAPGGFTAYGGHDVDLISCARDLAGSDALLFTLSCDADLVALRPVPGPPARMELVSRRATNSAARPGWWDDHLALGSPPAGPTTPLIVASSSDDDAAPMPSAYTRVVRVGPGHAVATIVEDDRTAVRDLAAQPGVALLITRDTARRFAAWRLDTTPPPAP